MKLKISITTLSLLAFLETAYMKESPTTISESVVIQNTEFKTDAFPGPLRLDQELGIVSAPFVKAEIIHRSPSERRQTRFV